MSRKEEIEEALEEARELYMRRIGISDETRSLSIVKIAEMLLRESEGE